ncbi:MAG: hypothetical protein JNJ54_05595 [Myxococcaceae bacterium]|nr:hypothetical protein [Myxococcaceae bacterium]
MARISAPTTNRNDAARAAAEAAKKAAEAGKKAAEAAKRAAEAAKRAAEGAQKRALQDAARSTSRFEGVKAGASAVVGARAAAEAKANVKEAAAKLSEASAKLEPLPTVAAEAKATADLATRVAETPTSRWGLVGDTLQGIKNKTLELAERAQNGVQNLTDTVKSKAQEGVQALKDATKSLDDAFDGGVKDLKRQVIEKPIDELQPGSKVELSTDANVGVAVPGLNVGAGGVSIKGKVQQKIEVKAEEDGSYTIKNELNALESVSIGGTTQRGVDVSADGGAGGSMTTEYKVKPVMVKNPDGTDTLVDGKPVIDQEATRAKVKELTSLLVTPPVKQGNPLLMQVKAPEDGRTDAQKALMNECYTATEYKGTLANQVSASLNLPNSGGVTGNGKTQQEVSLRIEKAEVPVRDANGKPVLQLDENGKPKLGDDGKPQVQLQDGVKITTGVTVASEISGEGSLNRSRVTTLNADGKLQAKTTLSTTLEYPGQSDLSLSDLSQLTAKKPHVSATVSQEVDVQLGGGAGVGLDLVAAKGSGRQMERIGATQTRTLTIDDPLKNGAEVLKQLSEGNLKDAARVAGDNTRVQIETQIYTERSRIAEGGLKLGKVVDLSTKAESVQRTPVARLPRVDATGTEIATATQQQLDAAQRKLEDASRDLQKRRVPLRP